jgi:hypothetical protein
MNSAGATDTDATSVLCSEEGQLVTQNPKQWRIRLCNDLSELAVDTQGILRHCQKPAQFDARAGTTLAADDLI